MQILHRSFGTHDGSFHADEVTACSLLSLYNLIDLDKVFRTRDPALLAKCEYVCDVGGVYDSAIKRFDHHQVEYKGAMSSAGMILLYLKERGVVDTPLYDLFNKCLILGVDAHDNGVAAKVEQGVATFSQIVSNFLPIEYEVTAEEMQKAFFQALHFVVGHLSRMRARFQYTRACQEKVKAAMGAAKEMLLFEESLPWMENFFDLGGEYHPAQFVIMPAGNLWKLRGIPPSISDRMKVRCPLPEAWAGLHEEALRAASGIEGAVFCHKGRFISIWKTKEAALKALHKVLARR